MNDTYKKAARMGWLGLSGLLGRQAHGYGILHACTPLPVK